MRSGGADGPSTAYLGVGLVLGLALRRVLADVIDLLSAPVVPHAVGALVGAACVVFALRAPRPSSPREPPAAPSVATAFWLGVT